MEDKGKMLEVNPATALEFETKSPTPHVNHKGGVKSTQSSNIQASFTLFKSFLGTGILALPYAYKTAGLGLALIVVLFVSILTTRCFFLMLDSADDRAGMRSISLPKLALEILGTKGQTAVQVSLMIMQLGCCIGILIFTRTFLDHVLCEFGVESLCGNTLFNLLFCALLAVPLCVINNMHYFYIPSLAANFFIIVGLSVQMYFNMEVLQANPENRVTFASHITEFNFTELPLFFGIATYAFEGVGIIFSIRGSMEKPQDFPALLKNQMIILTIIYLIFPTICYVAIGERLQDIIFFSLPTTDPFYLLIQILYAMSALFTFPIQLFPALRILENSKSLRFRLFTEAGKTKNKLLRYGMRLILIAFVFLVAYTANSFHLFLNLLGSCVFTFLGFVLPIWLYHAQFKGRIKMKTRLLNYTVLTVTIFFGTTGFVMSIIRMFTLGSE